MTERGSYCTNPPTLTVLSLQAQQVERQQYECLERQRCSLEKEAGGLFRKAWEIRRELMPGTRAEAESLSQLARHLQETGDEVQAKQVLQQERLVRLQVLLIECVINRMCYD
jgi:hypothetical protein